MTFWDCLVIRCCMGLGEGNFIGFHRARQLLQRASDRGLLTPAVLRPPTRLLLLLVFPAESPVHQAISPPNSHHGLAEAALYGYLGLVLRPRLADLHALGHHRGQRHVSLLGTIHRHLLIPKAVTFFTRLDFLPTEAVKRNADLTFVRDVFPSVEPALPRIDQIPQVHDGVEVALYRALLAQARWSEVPAWPPPAWVPPASDQERHFLEVCQSLAPEDRCILFLSIYGELTLRTVFQIVRGTVLPEATCDVELVTLHLCSAWQQVIDRL